MFSKACEYGIRATLYIAMNSLEDKRVSLRNIAGKIDSPEAFTAKILQQLVHHHIIHSVGFAMQKLGFKILNDISWYKVNPPPNLSCRYFVHSTETVLWAARSWRSQVSSARC